ncbi:MAG TPA: FHA domain-containing protein [Pirellulales bacterium]|nr:FHA domain-containing protein [Pirellulales bacterium]
MRVVLEVTSGPAAGRKIWLQAGQVAEIGSAAGMDLSLVDDRSLRAVHFALVCDFYGCRLLDRSGGRTSINGEAAGEAALRDGDSIHAGDTRFRVRIDGQAPMPVKAPSASANPGNDNPLPLATLELCQEAELGSPAKLLAADQRPVSDFCDLLLSKGLATDALRLWAQVLPKREAVWWACRSMATDLSDAQSDPGYVAAENWVLDPNDGNRRACLPAAEAAAMNSPGALAALAAYFSGGSLTAPDMPVVAPDPRLTARMASAAVLLSATGETGQIIAHKQQAALQRAGAVFRGLDKW